jgi:hypothetical protein
VNAASCELGLNRIKQQTEGRGGVLDAGLGLRGGEGVEEAVVVGAAVTRPLGAERRRGADL